ncbi:MAG: thermonuclease family protein [Metamycoplasmataceae bacterium]
MKIKNKFSLKKIFILFTFLSIGFVFNSCNFYTQSQYDKNQKTILIDNIYDGDTFYDNEKNSYRLIGVNAPEIKNNSNNYLRNFYAFEAKNFLFNLIYKKIIKINYFKKDYYKRNLIEAYFNNEDIGEKLIQSGLARVEFISNNKDDYYYYNEEYYHKLLRAENQAKKNKNGIWNYDFYTIQKIFSRK